MTAKIKKGDIVIVIAGDDKGKRGEVIKVMPSESMVVVQGVNIHKKHRRQVQQSRGRSMNPGIIETELPISIGSVMRECPHTNKPTRVGVVIEADGTPVRVSKKAEGKKID